MNIYNINFTQTFHLYTMDDLIFKQKKNPVAPFSLHTYKYIFLYKKQHRIVKIKNNKTTEWLELKRWNEFYALYKFIYVL